MLRILEFICMKWYNTNDTTTFRHVLNSITHKPTTSPSNKIQILPLSTQGHNFREMLRGGKWRDIAPCCAQPEPALQVLY